MSLKIKTKLRYGIGLLFAMIVLLGGLSVKNISDMSADTRNILADNYNSLLYSRRMLDALERIFEAEIQHFALGCCKIPERLPLRNAQAKPQGQPRLADFRRTREDVQALWNKLIYQKVRRFICPVLQIFCCDGFQFCHFFTSFRFYLL